MSRMRVFKKFLIPSSVAYGLQDGKREPVCDAEGKRLVRPSDLPIYGDECYICDGKPCDDPCAMEAQIGHLRKELWVWVDNYKGYRSKIYEVCAQGKVHAEISPNPSRTLYLEADGTPKEPRSVGKDSEPSKIIDKDEKSNKNHPVNDHDHHTHGSADSEDSPEGDDSSNPCPCHED